MTTIANPFRFPEDENTNRHLAQRYAFGWTVRELAQRFHMPAREVEKRIRRVAIRDVEVVVYGPTNTEEQWAGHMLSCPCGWSTWIRPGSSGDDEYHEHLTNDHPHRGN